MKAIHTKIIINSIRSRAGDKSIGFSATTPELTAEQKTAFFELQGIYLNTLLEPIDYPTDEVLEVEKDLNTKSPSQRLRSVLYLLHKQRGEQNTFREFYEQQMEKIITAYKERLE